MQLPSLSIHANINIQNSQSRQSKTCTQEHTPVQQQLQYTLCSSKGPIRGEEDAGVGQVIITKRCEECLYQALQCPRPDTPDLTRLQLADCVTWGQAVTLRLRESKREYIEGIIKGGKFLNMHSSNVQSEKSRNAEINRGRKRNRPWNCKHATTGNSTICF